MTCAHMLAAPCRHRRVAIPGARLVPPTCAQDIHLGAAVAAGPTRDRGCRQMPRRGAHDGGRRAARCGVPCALRQHRKLPGDPGRQPSRLYTDEPRLMSSAAGTRWNAGGRKLVRTGCGSSRAAAGRRLGCHVQQTLRDAGQHGRRISVCRRHASVRAVCTAGRRHSCHRAGGRSDTCGRRRGPGCCGTVSRATRRVDRNIHIQAAAPQPLTRLAAARRSVVWAHVRARWAAARRAAARRAHAVVLWRAAWRVERRDGHKPQPHSAGAQRACHGRQQSGHFWVCVRKLARCSLRHGAGIAGAALSVAAACLRQVQERRRR